MGKLLVQQMERSLVGQCFLSQWIVWLRQGEPQLIKSWWQKGPPEHCRTFSRSGTPLMGADTTLWGLCVVLTLHPLHHCKVPVGKMLKNRLTLNGPTWPVFVQGGESHLIWCWPSDWHLSECCLNVLEQLRDTWGPVILPSVPASWWILISHQGSTNPLSMPKDQSIWLWRSGLCPAPTPHC